MTNSKWTTLVEERTEKANEAISEILDEAEDGIKARNNKAIAMGMAAIGVTLIAFGISPLLGLKANISEDNIFTEPEEVVIVEPSEDIEASEDLDSIFSQLKVDENILPVDESLNEEGNVNVENIFAQEAQPLKMNTPEEFVFLQDLDPEQDTSLFPQNTHIGGVDKNVMVFGENGKTTMIQNEKLHAAAGQDMADAGPEMWFAGIFAVFAAFALRKRRIFG